MKRLFAICFLLVAVSCDDPKPQTLRTVAAQGTPPASVAPPVLTVNHIATQIHQYTHAPSWFVQVEYLLANSNLPHVVIESTASYNGVLYGNVRAYDLANPPDYDVFYDGAAPSGRSIVCYPAEVVGGNWHNGRCWVDENPWGMNVIIWHIDVTYPDIWLHKRQGKVVRSDRSAEVRWSIDVTAQSLVTVVIP